MLNDMNHKRSNCQPDISGNGSDLLNIVQVLQSKIIHEGYFQTDFLLKFSATFEYPAVFKLRSSGSILGTSAIAFDVKQKDKTKQLVEEKLIVPKVCKNITRDSLLCYLADVVEKNMNFVFYLSNKPSEYDTLTFYLIEENQNIVFTGHMIMAVIRILDERKNLL